MRPPQAGAWRGIRLITSGRLPLAVFFEPLGINGWGQILRAKVRLSRVDPMHALDLTNSQERSRTCVPRGACPARDRRAGGGASAGTGAKSSGPTQC